MATTIAPKKSAPRAHPPALQMVVACRHRYEGEERIVLSGHQKVTSRTRTTSTSSSRQDSSEKPLRPVQRTAFLFKPRVREPPVLSNWTPAKDKAKAKMEKEKAKAKMEKDRAKKAELKAKKAEKAAAKKEKTRAAKSTLKNTPKKTAKKTPTKSKKPSAKKAEVKQAKKVTSKPTKTNASKPTKKLVKPTTKVVKPSKAVNKPAAKPQEGLPNPAKKYSVLKNYNTKRLFSEPQHIQERIVSVVASSTK